MGWQEESQDLAEVGIRGADLCRARRNLSDLTDMPTSARLVTLIVSLADSRRVVVVVARPGLSWLPAVCHALTLSHQPDAHGTGQCADVTARQGGLMAAAPSRT